MRPGSKHRTFVRVTLSAALVAGMFVAGGSTALADCGETVYVDAYDVQLEPRRDVYRVGDRGVADCGETVYVDAYDVQLEPRRDVYRVGDTAVFDGVVTRTDTGMPVSDASFFVYIPPNRKGFVAGWSRTDGAGEAVLKMKLERGEVQTGPAKVVGRAQQERADTTCAQVVEFGEIELERAFTIKR